MADFQPEGHIIDYSVFFVNYYTGGVAITIHLSEKN